MTVEMPPQHAALAQVAVPLATAICGGGYIDVPALDGRVLRVPLKEARACVVCEFLQQLVEAIIDLFRYP